MKLSSFNKFILSILLIFNIFSCKTDTSVNPEVTVQNLQKDEDFNRLVSSLTKMRLRFDIRMSEYRSFEDVEKHRNTIEFLAAQSDPISQERLIKELGFKDKGDYLTIQSELYNSKARLFKKYGIDSSSDLAEFEGVMKGALSESRTLVKAREGLCIHCFFNNCDNCTGGTGEGKESHIPDSGGGNCFNEKNKCLNDATRQKEIDINLARGEYHEKAALCLMGAIGAGGLAAGQTIYLGPFSIPAGGAVFGITGGSCLYGVYLQYSSKIESAELKYQQSKDSCYSRFKC